MTLFLSSINNIPLIIFNHFLLKEFVNPLILSVCFYSYGVRSSYIFFIVCSEWFLILDHCWNLILLYIFYLRDFALWFNISTNIFARWSEERYLEWCLNICYPPNFVHHLFNQYLFICSFNTDGFYVHSIVLCIGHTTEAWDSLYKAEPYEIADTLQFLTCKRAILHALT